MEGGGRRYRLRPCDPAAAAELGRALSLSPTVAQLLLHRGFSDTEAARGFLNPSLAGLTLPHAMADRVPAVERLARAVQRRERIVIFGDYDVDGTTSAAILSCVLAELGAVVHTLIADRFLGGYGLSAQALERILSLAPQLVITCDCGSSDHERLAALRQQGVDVVVVDHHLVPEEPLPVVAFLNPHRPDCGSGYKGLCSAGLSFVLAASLRTALGVQLDLRPFLDMVALGTIADVVPLTGDNRRLVRAGLKRLSPRGPRPGIVALCEVAKVRQDALSAIDVAFRLAPRLNAPGRLGQPGLTLALLTATTLEEARGLAAQVETCNQERRRIEQQVTEGATAQVRAVYGDAPEDGIVVAAADFHPGVVGISAARLVERFNVPAVVVSLSEPHGHGSARAPAGFPLHDALSRCAATLVRFGGHQAAGGVALAPPQLEAFRKSFAEACRALAAGRKPPVAEVDLQLAVGPYALPNASELSLLEPLGEANAEPLFHVPLAVVTGASEVGEGHLKLQLKAGGQRLSAFGYRLATCGVPAVGTQVQLFGTLRRDTWMGGEAVEFRLEAVHAATEAVLLPLLSTSDPG